MIDLKYHYKDRLPNETIQIITKFFEDRGYNIQKMSNVKTSAGTYYSNFLLYWKNYKVMGTNGKGLTQEFSEASCLAEMYERFCSMVAEGQFVNKRIKDTYKDREYTIISKDYFLNDEYIKKYLDIMLPEQTDYYFDKYIKNFYNNQIYGNKFINIDNSNDIIYKNEHMNFATCGSTGLAAGNTLEEALVQGISEYYERLTNQYFFENIFNSKYQYFEIDQSILPEHLQQIILQAEKNDYCKIKLFDFSYTFNLPVVVLILQDLNANTYYLCAGASPIFEVATERCLTEVYQGLYHHNQKVKYITFPEYTNWEFVNSKQNQSHDTELMFVPENLLFHSIKINKYNTEIFLNNDKYYSNQEILNKIKEINKINNINIYYYDMSLTDEIKAVRILNKEFISKTCLINHKKWAGQYTKEELALLFEINIKIIQGYNYILENNPQNLSNDQIELYFEELKLIMQPILNKFGIDKILSSFQNLHTELYNIYLTGQKAGEQLFYNNQLIWNIYENDLPVHTSREQTLYPIVDKWVIVKEYLNKGYSIEQIKTILQFLNYSINDIPEKAKKIDKIFIIRKICEYLYDLYNNSDYYNFIKSFNKKNSQIN